MKNIFARFVNDESGATAIEYGLIAALISVMLIAGATMVGGQLDAIFKMIDGSLQKGLTAANASQNGAGTGGAGGTGG